jgi:hypothetical protein
MSRLVLLSEWAKREFGEPVPGASTLSKYAKNGMISPPPCKVGKSWRVAAGQNSRFPGAKLLIASSQRGEDERLEALKREKEHITDGTC